MFVVMIATTKGGEMTSACDQLQQLGFSQYEAQAYVSLLQNNPLNGYELAKASGVPRPNIYSVLQKLEERNAVVRVDSTEGTRYSPVPADELLRRLHLQFQTSLDLASRTLDELTVPKEPEQVWNASGTRTLMDHAQALIDSAQEQILLAVWPQEAAALESSLQRAEERGVKITTFCLTGCAQECGACKGQVHRYAITRGNAFRWLVLAQDHTEVLTGEIFSEDNARMVRTKQRLLVELASGYIRHTIALAALLEDSEARLDQSLTSNTQTILASFAPVSLNVGWLENLRGRINSN